MKKIGFFAAVLLLSGSLHAADDSAQLKEEFVAECVDGRSGQAAAELGLQSVKDVQYLQANVLQPICTCMHEHIAASFERADEWDAVLRDENSDFAAPELTRKLAAAARACTR